MPRRRSQPGTAVSALQQGRLKRHPLDAPGGRTSECLVPSCDGLPLSEAPVALCGKHTREVWQYAQGVIENNLLAAVLEVMDE